MLKLRKRKTRTENLPAIIDPAKGRDVKGHFIKGNKISHIANTIQPPPDAAKTVLELTSRGIIETSIARALGVSYVTWLKWRDEYPELQEAWDIGRAKEHDSLFSVLFESATKSKNITAAMFLLKCRHGYKDQSGEGFLVENKISITYDLPGSLSTKEYEAKLIRESLPKKELKKLIRE